MTGETLQNEAIHKHAEWLRTLGATAFEWAVGSTSPQAAKQVINIQRTDAELAAATAQAHQNAQ